MTTPQRFRALRPRFGLRTLFVLVTFLALAAAWFCGEIRIARERQDLAREITRRGGSVYTAQELAITEIPQRLTWIRRRCGDQEIGQIYLWADAFQAVDFERIQALFPEARLWPPGPGPDADTVAQASEPTR